MLTNIPLLLMRNSPCFLIAVMLPYICGHESSLQECCSVFVLCENVRLGDGYTDDKHLSRVSLTCFIMRTHWLYSILEHTTHTAYDTIWFAASLMVCIVAYRGVSYRGYLQSHDIVSWQYLCIVTSPIHTHLWPMNYELWTIKYELWAMSYELWAMSYDIGTEIYWKLLFPLIFTNV